MALWGLGIFFTFTLLKMASWVGALTVTAKLFITRYFDSKEKARTEETARKEAELEIEYNKLKDKKTEALTNSIESFMGRSNEIALISLLEYVRSHAEYTHLIEDSLIEAKRTLERSKAFSAQIEKNLNKRL
jgi:hypothetical protein